MDIRLLTGILTCLPVLLCAQYQGGGGDGCGRTAVNVPMNIPVYSHGGDNDGYTSTGLVSASNVQAEYSLGGPGDGYGMKFIHSEILIENSYSLGGRGDGYGIMRSISSMNRQVCIFGGSGDGFVSLMKVLSLSNLRYVYGGDGDGISRLEEIQLMTRQFCTRGGEEDGYKQARRSVSLSNQQYVNGGVGDGYNQARRSVPFSNQQYVNGGVGDGYEQARRSVPFSDQQYVNGGVGDGYNLVRKGSNMNYQQYVQGGTGDGQDRNLFHALFGPGVWQGLFSSEWTAAENWLCNMVPDQTVPVTVPPACPHYPYLGGELSINSASGSYLCRSLTIHPEASVSSSGSLSVAGTMTVKGNYTSYCSINHSQNILNGGELLLYSQGIIRLGTQSTGPGTTDLIVHSGGTLSVTGGILEIDDQLNLLDGSMFTMDSGLVFAHKYGNGSDYDESNPGALHASPGSYGNISGGLLKVCGRTSNDTLAAINIATSSFIFADTATLEITHGVCPGHFDAELKAADGISFGNVFINKTGAVVRLSSDLNVSGILVIGPGAWLAISDGNNITVGASPPVEP